MSHNFIDDQDLTRVKYHGSWIQGGGPSEHQGTVASSTVEGDYFTVSFYGNIISVFGTIDATSGGVITNYSIDGAAPTQITSQAGGGDTYDQQFWRSGFLSVGNHELKVTMIKVNPDPIPGEGTIWFDYFKATDPTIRPDSAAKKRHIGAIAGGIVGGVVLLGILLALWVMLRRSRRRKVGGSNHGHERLPDGEKPASLLPSGHVDDERSMSGRGSIRPFIDPPSLANPNNGDQASPSPISPTTPITPGSGIVPPQKLLQELSRSQGQSSSPPSRHTGSHGAKHMNSASSSTLRSTSAGGSAFVAGGASESASGPSSSPAQTSQGNSEMSPSTPTVRLSPIFLGAPERPSPPGNLTAKQEAIINVAAGGSIEDLVRESELQRPQQSASHSGVAQDEDSQRQAPIIVHVDSGVRHTMLLDSQDERGENSTDQVGDSGASAAGPAITIAPALPIELPPVYSPV